MDFLTSGMMRVYTAFGIDAMNYTDNKQGITEAHIAHAKLVRQKFELLEEGLDQPLFPEGFDEERHSIR